MGGRGASSGISDKGVRYGQEYRSVLEYGNIKFVKRNTGNTTAPLETMTRGRVYATIDAHDNAKYVSYYDNENKRSKTIDLGHKHNGLDPHVHHGYEHNENDGPSGAARLTQQEKKLLDKILHVWQNR